MSSVRNALLIPGQPTRERYYDPAVPSPSNDHWFPWLAKQLSIRDIHAVCIEMPRAFEPRYPLWKREFDRYEIGRETILVGHSTGAGFLLRYLSENRSVRPGRVVLVAPWLDPERNPRWDCGDFFDFVLDRHLVERTRALVVFSSLDDKPDVLDSVEIIRQTLTGVRFREFSDRGHFTVSLPDTEAFPELLLECLERVE
jgi:predicted alpha/beta hydrolase family esterase